ncbi:MAG: RAD55 family ATPase [Candidatus Jordarchaeum sp.]|uniref:RAD55 family ATPase n=1 Tax=Candidatus Jordarchaeum sp. TaxID=2823881 RepID=UPI004049E920
MSDYSYLPEELIWALSVDGYSLHIKGAAGTGKTTLALELVKAFSDRKSSYLSTRLTSEKLYYLYPWIEKDIPLGNIIDAKKPIARDSSDLDTKFLEYIDKSDYLKAIYSKIRENRKSIVIIDNLDALKNSLGLPTNDLSLESTLLDIGGKKGANIVFVSETDSESALDFLVDGIVTLRKQLNDGRVLREIIIEKMRGTEIKYPVCLFTLTKGRFTHFKNSFHSIPTREKIEEQKAEEAEPDKIPTTIRELDKILEGGLKKSSLNVMELGQGIGLEHIDMLSPFYVSVISQNYPAILIPSRSISFLDISPLKKALMENPALLHNFKKLVHVFLPTKLSVDVSVLDKPENVHYLESRDYREDIHQIKGVTQEILKNSEKKLFFVGISSDVVSYSYGIQNFSKVLSLWVNQLKLLGATIGVFYYPQKNQQILSQFTDVYLKFEKINGILMLYGIIPKTQYYAVTLDYSKKTPTILTPIE